MVETDSVGRLGRAGIPPTRRTGRYRHFKQGRCREDYRAWRPFVIETTRSIEVASRRQPLRGGAEPGEPSELISARQRKGVVLKSAKREELTSLWCRAAVTVVPPVISLLIDDAARALDMTSPSLCRSGFRPVISFAFTRNQDCIWTATATPLTMPPFSSLDERGLETLSLQTPGEFRARGHDTSAKQTGNRIQACKSLKQHVSAHKMAVSHAARRIKAL
jgi:hypothetical protein